MTKHAVMDWEILGKYQVGYVATPQSIDDRKFAGMLSVPYLTPGGIKSLKYRRISGDGGKYAQYEGQKPRLYNTAAGFAAGTEIGLSEGELDAIVATERLGIPTIGIPGTEMWIANAKTWAPIFKDFSRVFVFADGDPPMCMCSPRCTGQCTKPVRPGEQLARRVAQSLGWRAQIIWCPEGEDVASMVAAGHAESLMNQIESK